MIQKIKVSLAGEARCILQKGYWQIGKESWKLRDSKRILDSSKNCLMRLSRLKSCENSSPELKIYLWIRLFEKFKWLRTMRSTTTKLWPKTPMLFMANTLSHNKMLGLSWVMARGMVKSNQLPQSMVKALWCLQQLAVASAPTLILKTLARGERQLSSST